MVDDEIRRLDVHIDEALLAWGRERLQRGFQTHSIPLGVMISESLRKAREGDGAFVEDPENLGRAG